MIQFPRNKAPWSLGLGALVILFLAFAWPTRGQNQSKSAAPAKHAAHPDGPGATGKAETGNKPLADQLAELRAKVATLEAALSRKWPAPAAASGPTPGMGMGMMGRMGGGAMSPGGAMSLPGGGATPMMDDDSMEMGPMAGPPDGAGMGMRGMGSMGGGPAGAMGGGMGMMDDASEMSMMGMGAMGKAQGMAGMAVPSALPGFPGASHLYHVGATGFFLNHDAHVTLTPAQKTALNQIKQKALLDAATARREVDQAEQELWALTAADEPQAEAIEAKVREVEKARGDQRMAFIRAVGEAANVLTPEQRQKLLGAAGTDAAPAP